MNPLPFARALGIASALLALPAPAQGVAPGQVARVAGLSDGSTLNMRAGPGTGFPVIGILAAGQSGLAVRDCASDGAWCRVETDGGADGWVFATYLAPVVPAPLAPAPPSPPAWRAMFSTEIAYRISGIDAGSALNVRAGPGTENAVLSRLEAGRGVTIRDCTDDGSWCEVAAEGGRLGWVASRFLSDTADTTGVSSAPVAERRASEATRLASTTGIAVEPGQTATIPELPPHLLGAWDVDRAACDRGESETRVTVLKNGLRVGAATARFKNAIFRDEGYDLTTLLMRERNVVNTVPQRALYRLEPGEDTLAVSGDVLSTRQLRRCESQNASR